MYVVRELRRVSPKWVAVTAVDDRLRIRRGVVRFSDTSNERLPAALVRLFGKD